MRKTEKMSTPPYVRLRYLLVWRMRICGVVYVFINKSNGRLLPCLHKNRKLITDHVFTISTFTLLSCIMSAACLPW